MTVETLVRAAIAEDIGDGDWTSEWTIDERTRGVAVVRAKAAGVIAGTEPAELSFGTVDPALVATWSLRDGDAVEPGAEVVRIEGSLRGMLGAERVALNFLGRLSGIATLAARFAAEVAGTGARVVDTRKTTPGWRSLEKAAVRAGGCANHRAGLYDMVLIKENHVRAAGGVAAALNRVADAAKAAGIEVEVEVRTLEELDEALSHGPDRVLLDNMSLDELRRAVELARSRGDEPPLLEASGSVRLDDARAIAETGVDLISVGALTHSAPPLDLSLLVVD
ncbi:MAG: carboxylating nicotinate-nucleotide diphosphorylase [Gemmatimonadetes bacterium]|nr:carboxylating nicotinate-nucleotide diphosphorylase [Gemmatimonadota bacterium]